MSEKKHVGTDAMRETIVFNVFLFSVFSFKCIVFSDSAQSVEEGILMVLNITCKSTSGAVVQGTGPEKGLGYLGLPPVCFVGG